jgi:hypothetical protein
MGGWGMESTADLSEFSVSNRLQCPTNLCNGSPLIFLCSMKQSLVQVAVYLDCLDHVLKQSSTGMLAYIGKTLL